MIPRLCLKPIICNHPDEGIKPHTAPVAGQLQALAWGEPLTLLLQLWVPQVPTGDSSRDTSHGRTQLQSAPIPPGMEHLRLDLRGSLSSGLLKHGKEDPC